jgi:hypothetical protein
LRAGVNYDAVFWICAAWHCCRTRPSSDRAPRLVSCCFQIQRLKQLSCEPEHKPSRFDLDVR